MLVNLLKLGALLPLAVPFYGLAGTFAPKLRLDPDCPPLNLSRSDREEFSLIKKSVRIKGKIALYGEGNYCVSTNKWATANPILVTDYFNMHDRKNTSRLFLLRQNLILIRKHHGFLPYLVWNVCIAVGAYFMFRKKTHNFLVLAYFIGKYFCEKLILMEKNQAEIEAITLSTAPQLKNALDLYQNLFRNFKRKREESLYLRLFYRADGSPRSGGILWEKRIVPILPRIKRLEAAYSEKATEEGKSKLA